MAKRKKPGAKSIEIYKHKTQKRKNNPQAGVVTSETDNPQVKTKKYKYDPNLDPELQWAGKAERLSFDVPTVPLHIHEKIDPRSIIEIVRRRNAVDYGQMSLFHDESEKHPLEKEIEFYKHEKLWSNRLIAGDSLVVMNSLLEKEGMAGKVQCVYMDPPYGIEYKSNFQPFVNNTIVTEKDQDLTAEPESIKAFSDTWELKTHSYISYLRDRIKLAHKLLNEKGSLFIQISSENLSYATLLCDEIFGKENFMSLITYRTKTVLGPKYLGNITDYIVWYAKQKYDSKKKPFCKFNRLFSDRDVGEGTPFTWIEDPEGNRRRMTQQEKKNPVAIPKDLKIFRIDNIISSGRTESCVFEMEISGKKYLPLGGRKSWKTNKKGMETLIKNRRVEIPKKTPGYVFFHEDYPVQELTNVWTKTQGAFNKVYAVQTSDKVIQRCILMSTNPGDLVFDPTCGSGTTAYAAEKWGRRWITCDTSRVAVTLAKQRLMTATFDYYKLKDEKKGISGDLKYKQVPHITLGSIANNTETEKETLYDQPDIDRNKFRVSGPFTVEAVPAVKVETLSGKIPNESESSVKQDWLFSLKEHGIKGKKGLLQDIQFTRLEIMNDTKYIFAEGETKTDRKRVIVCFGSEYAPLEQRQVELALKEAKLFRPDIVIFCAFQFDPEAGKDVDELDLKWTKVLKVQMNSDLFTEDLKKKTKGESFWLVGQPDISLKKIAKGEHKGKYTVSLEGFDYYDTKTNSIQRGGKDRIALWMLDTDYDGRSLYPRQVFFPLSESKGGWERLKKTLRSEINEDLIDRFKGTESLPFKKENHKKIAVKIIDDRGIESLIIKPLN